MKAGMLSAVDDLDAAVAFYRDGLGALVKFRDGDRYCALDLGGVTLGLLAGSERMVSETALSLRVADVDAALDRLKGRNAQMVRAVESGPHERRAVLRAPGGALVVLSGPLVAQS